MRYLHPLFMVILLFVLYFIRKEGKKALGINLKSPEASQYQTIIKKHRQIAYIMTALVFIGLIIGVYTTVYSIGVKTAFEYSRGHGYLGAILLGLLISNIFIGHTIKKTNNERSRKKVKQLHYALFYSALVAAVLALITGAVFLFSGPASA